MAGKDSKDRAKRMQQAEKFVLQGKIANAIAEYQKIAEETPSDISLLNTIGDLYVLSGQSSQAITYFARVAEAYIKSGFITKAIAMQKKVVNLNPQNLDAVSKLADLYLKQGLNADARVQYLAVAGALEKKGQEREAIEHYRKAIELNPEDGETEWRLAQLYVRQKNPEQAKLFFSRAGTHLIEARRTDQGRKALAQALELDPAYILALRGCVKLSQATGQHAEILQRLEEAHQAKPGQADLMELLGEVYLAAGRPDDAEPYLQKALALDENRYEHFFKLATYYYNQSNWDKALQQIQIVMPILLTRRETQRIIAFVNEVLEINPTHLMALSLLAEVYSKTNSKKEATATLSKIVDIQISHENYKEALRLIEQIVEAEPGDAKLLQLHREIFGEVYPDQPYRPLVPEPSREEPEKTPSEVFSENVAARRAAGPPDTKADEEIDFEIDLSEDLKDIFAPDPPPKAPAAERAASDRSPIESKPAMESKPAADPQAAQGALELTSLEEKPAAGEDAALETGVQEVEFYARLGFLGEAQKRLLELAQDFPEHPSVLRQREMLQAEAQNAGVTLPEVEWPSPPAPTPKAEAPKAEAPPVEAPVPAIDKSQPMDNNNGAARAGLDAEVREHPEGPDVLSKFSIKRLEGIRPDEGPDQNQQKPFTERVKEIKSLIDEDKEEDFQTQFDLGVAYKEMGLLDEAIGQFQAAYRSAKETGEQRKMALCCSLLANCFMEKGMPPATIRWAKLGLVTPGLSEDEMHALKYELALAYEKCGDAQQALEYFHEIYEMNIHYRDVAQRIVHLSNSVKTK